MYYFYSTWPQRIAALGIYPSGKLCTEPIFSIIKQVLGLTKEQPGGFVPNGTFSFFAVGWFNDDFN